MLLNVLRSAQWCWLQAVAKPLANQGFDGHPTCAPNTSAAQPVHS